MTTGQKLVALRGKRTISEVARNVGVAPNTMGYYETDKRRPGDKIKKRISEYYKRSVQYIFFD